MAGADDSTRPRAFSDKSPNLLDVLRIVANQQRSHRCNGLQLSLGRNKHPRGFGDLPGVLTAQINSVGFQHRVRVAEFLEVHDDQALTSGQITVSVRKQQRVEHFFEGDVAVHTVHFPGQILPEQQIDLPRLADGEQSVLEREVSKGDASPRRERLIDVRTRLRSLLRGGSPRSEEQTGRHDKKSEHDSRACPRGSAAGRQSSVHEFANGQVRPGSPATRWSVAHIRVHVER